MDVLKTVTDSFDSRLKEIYKDHPETLKHLLTHERKNLCIENLMKEIRMIEFTNAVKLDGERIKEIGKMYAGTFAKIALGHAEEKLKTEAQKIDERRKQEENEYFEKLFNEEVEEQDRSIGLG